MIHLRYISMKEIREDFFFCFHSRLEFPALTDSIRISGIRLPLFVENAEEGFRIVSGFRRWNAAKSLQLESVPAEIIATQDVPLKLVEIILEQRTSEALNLVEKARILSIASRLNVDLQDLLPGLELAEQPKQLNAMKNLLNYPQQVLDYIEQYDVSLKKCRMFNGVPEPVLQSMIRFADVFQIRSVELAEILNGLKEIARQSGASVESIQKKMTEAVGNLDALNRNQIIQAYKDWILMKKSPRLSEWNQSIQTVNMALKMPSCIQMTWDKSLESPGIQMNAQLRSEADIQKIADLLSDPERQSLWKKIFKIL